jgi:hypothetical protein
MTDIAPAKNPIQIEETQFRMPVSEGLLAKIGQNINYFALNTLLSVQNNAGTNFPNGSEGIVPYSTTLLDTNTGWDGNFYTIPYTGNYLIIANFSTLNNNPGAGLLMESSIKKNTTAVLAASRTSDADAYRSDIVITLATLTQYDTINTTQHPQSSISGYTLTTSVGANSLIIIKIG